ncbi:MAG: PepSY-associated TM helix domain-containing protein [Pseudomonadota bacterium]
MADANSVDTSNIEHEERGFRQVMSVVHTWSTLIPIWVLYFVFITGTIGYFHVEVSNWMKPEIEHVAEPVDEAVMFEHATKYLSENAAGATTWSISLPSERRETSFIFWSRALTPEEEGTLTPEEQEELREANSGNVVLDPVTGATYGDEVRATGGGDLLYRMHYVLHYMPRAIGEYIVIICTILMFAGLVTGIIIHKKIFKDFFTFRPAKGQRSWLDVHNISSVMTLPFQLMITFSGMLFYVATIMPLVFYGPTATLGFDVEDILTSESIADINPKNQELVGILAEEVFGITPTPEAAGVPASMVPLSEITSDFRSRYPDATIDRLILQNPTDANATATMRFVPGIGSSAIGLANYSATTGERLGDPAAESEGSVAGNIRTTILALHEGRFSPIVLRWLYFLSGLAGAVMIASGAVLWAKKRRQAHETELKRIAKRRAGSGDADTAPKIGKGVIFVEHMNVMTIIGLPIGVAAYFLANRLIPVGLEERGSLEADAMFIAWALTLVIAILRPRSRIWTELMWLACATYAAIPFVNAITTDRHLGISLPAGDWMMAGFDLTMFGIAFLFGLAAYRSTANQRGAKTDQKPALQQPVLDAAE